MKRSLQGYDPIQKRLRTINIQRNQEVTNRTNDYCDNIIYHHNHHDRGLVVECVLHILSNSSEKEFLNKVFGISGASNRYDAGILDRMFYESEYKEILLNMIKHYLSNIDGDTFSYMMEKFD